MLVVAGSHSHLKNGLIGVNVFEVVLPGTTNANKEYIFKIVFWKCIFVVVAAFTFGACDAN